MILYSTTACENLMRHYVNNGGESVTLEEGVLGLGLVVCFCKGMRTAIIREVPLNERSSAHKVRVYSKMPEKYRAMLRKKGVL